jgi:signal transduction histidine kinase
MARDPIDDCPDPARFWPRLGPAVAGSYALDAGILLLFAWAGAIAPWVAGAYLGVGLTLCAGFHLAIRSGVTRRGDDPLLVLPQLAAAALVQVTFIVLAPPVAMYFVGLLFVVFGFASLRMRLRDALLAWLAVSIAVSVAIALLPGALHLPDDGYVQRLLVGFSILLALGRSMLLGIYGSWIRMRYVRRYVALLASTATSERRDAAVARTLHEDLGQELAGVALALAAHETQLRRAGAVGAGDVAVAVAQLRAAVEKTRRLAVSLDAAPAPPVIERTLAESLQPVGPRAALPARQRLGD